MTHKTRIILPNSSFSVPMKFAEDYLGFDAEARAEADAEHEEALPTPDEIAEMEHETDEELRLEYEAGLSEMTLYRFYNPHAHLLHCSFLTRDEWECIKARLTPADLASIENGGVVQVGAAAKVWKPEARK